MLPRLQTMENHSLAHRLKLSIQQLDEIQLHSETAQKHYILQYIGRVMKNIPVGSFTSQEKKNIFVRHTWDMPSLPS